MARRQYAALLAAAGKLPLSPAVAPPRPVRDRSDRAWLGRLARQRIRAAEGSDARRRSRAPRARLGADCLAVRPQPAAHPADADFRRGRPERPALGAWRVRGRLLYAAVDGSASARRRPRAGP